MKNTLETLNKIANLETISNQLNDVIAKTITLTNCKDEEFLNLIKKIDTKNKANRQYTKFFALCQLILAYDKVREYKEYNKKKFIVSCPSLIEATQLVNDIYYSGFSETVYLKADNEYDNEAKAFNNTFNVMFTIRYYAYGIKAEILANAGVQLIAPEKESEQEVRELQQDELALAESLLASAGLDLNLLVRK